VTVAFAKIGSRVLDYPILGIGFRYKIADMLRMGIQIVNIHVPGTVLTFLGC